MEYPYKVYITKEDVLKRGYDLTQTLSVDDQGHIDATIDSFLEEVASTIYNLVLTKVSDPTIAKYICTLESYQNDIAICQLEQAVYLLENGNLLSTSGEGTNLTLDDIRGAKAYSAIAYNHVEVMTKYLFGGIF